MTLANFQDILIEIIGTPTNDSEGFLIYLLSCMIGVAVLTIPFYFINLLSKIIKIK